MKISLGKRLSLILFAGYFTVLVLMAITLAVTIQNTGTVKQHSRAVLDTQMPLMLQLMDLNLQLFQSLNQLNEFLITGANFDRQRFYTSMKQLRNLSQDENLIAGLDKGLSSELSELLQAYAKKADQVIQLREDDQKNYQGISSAAVLLNPYHQQYISLIDTIINNRFEEDDVADNHEAVVRLINVRNSWINMIMSLRVYFTTRSERDYERIFLYQEQNLVDMKRLLAIKDRLEFDALFVEQLSEIHTIYMQNLPKVLEIYQTKKWRMDTYFIRHDIYPITNQLTELIESLVGRHQTTTQAESDLLTNELVDLTTIFKTAFAISFLISILVIYVVTRNIRHMVDALDNSHQDAIKRSEMLQKSSYELAESLDKLQSTQSQLIEHEKMAALGNLVAGMAHEINTPIGVGVMATSHITENTAKLEKKFKEGNIKKTDFVNYIKDTKEANEIMLMNLKRAADLIRSFKQIAVDQSTEDLREFELCEYIHEVYNSLIPTFKKTKIKVNIICHEKIMMFSYPGALAQVMTNLMTNSVLHGYEQDQEGIIYIQAEQESESTISLYYQDDGNGMDEKTLSKIFDPFFTTKRGKGGSGLGMHLLYNLITQKLMGVVKIHSSPGEGVKVNITMPARIQRLQERNDER